MPNPDLQNYITQARQQGMTDDQIRQNLVAKGWAMAQIDLALSEDQQFSKTWSKLLGFGIIVVIISVITGTIFTLHAYGPYSLWLGGAVWGSIAFAAYVGFCLIFLIFKSLNLKRRGFSREGDKTLWLFFGIVAALLIILIYMMRYP